jgi:hypothetical protein
VEERVEAALTVEGEGVGGGGGGMNQGEGKQADESSSEEEGEEGVEDPEVGVKEATVASM